MYVKCELLLSAQPIGGVWCCGKALDLQLQGASFESLLGYLVALGEDLLCFTHNHQGGTSVKP
jgi:hypothetical protein